MQDEEDPEVDAPEFAGANMAGGDDDGTRTRQRYVVIHTNR